MNGGKIMLKNCANCIHFHECDNVAKENPNMIPHDKGEKYEY